MLRYAVATSVFAAVALADGFTFTIASPMAAQEAQFKSAAFVFRTERCADPAKSQISASAEGIVQAKRRSVPLKVASLQKPGVYAVFQNWGNEGRWVVVLKGVCAGETAAAIVPLGRKGFLRESAKFFPRPATDAEVDASLKSLVEGDSK